MSYSGAGRIRLDVGGGHQPARAMQASFRRGLLHAPPKPTARLRREPLARGLPFGRIETLVAVLVELARRPSRLPPNGPPKPRWALSPLTGPRSGAPASGAAAAPLRHQSTSGRSLSIHSVPRRRGHVRLLAPVRRSVVRAPVSVTLCTPSRRFSALHELARPILPVRSGRRVRHLDRHALLAGRHRHQRARGRASRSRRRPSSAVRHRCPSPMRT